MTPFSYMREELEKEAKLSEDVPWYTTAAGATGGVLAAQKYLPQRYKGVGQIGGALLGTGLGLAAGNPISKKLKGKEGEKKAEAEEMPPHPAVTLGKTVGGMGAGMLAGYGAARGVEHLSGGVKNKTLRWALPLVTGAGGMALAHSQGQTLDKMRQDHLKRQEIKRERKSK